MIVLTMIMAFIITVMYQKIKEDASIMKTMVFSYMLWLIARSFFANSFFDWFTLSTMWTLMVWGLSILLFVRSKNELEEEQWQLWGK